MKTEPVVLALMSSASAALMRACIDSFSRYGLALARCLSMADVIHRLRVKTGDPLVVILDAQDPKGAEAISVLRSLHVNLGIVAITRPGDEASMIQLLHRGADMYCPHTASSELLLAIVLRLLWRVRTTAQTLPVTVMRAHPADESIWQLVDRDWALCCPDGQSIALTTGERAFLSTLLNAPFQQAPHTLLIEAVNASYNIDDPRTDPTRLGVMVSRLRRKFHRVGTPLPLKSIHGWGYMFGVNPGDRSE